ncbi:hypothetical protein [Paraburkholderia youngii]|uniref:hypothetical protein n=1 Tax=Paraburkholderia youngii TaxID=2782701 RepID=UPI003D22534C
MKLKKITKALLASAACASFLAGCATSGQGQLVSAPNRPTEATVTAYQPLPTDVYVANVVDRDVVFVGGVTYIWVVGRDGVRQRQFYAHGDRRAEVFHRREELRRVMASHDGHLPGYPGDARAPLARPVGPSPAMAAHGEPPRAHRHATLPLRPARVTAAHGQPRRANMKVAGPVTPAPAPSGKRVPKEPSKS